MAAHAIVGGGGTTLHVEETGTADGRPIVFIHGFSQCGLAWKKQTDSELASEFRLVTPDIRGHGASEKPRDAYSDSMLWAQDIDAVITGLRLDAPVLVGWSYGGVIISDYIRHFGEARLGGIQLVGAVSRLGEPLMSASFLDPHFVTLVPGFFSDDANESVAALTGLLRLCVQQELAPADRYAMLGAAAAVPPYVRQGLLARNLDNDDVFAALHTPVSLVYGEADRIVSPRMSTHLEQLMPHAKVSTYAGVGHMPFWEDPQRFNRELRDFVVTCARARGAHV